MRTLIAVFVAALASAAAAQDKVTLTNGDILTGKIKSMADGKLTLTSPLLQDVVVPLTSVSDIRTEEAVRLETKSGDLLNRRILGLENRDLRLDGDLRSLPLESLGRINPPTDPPPSWNGSLKVTGLYASGNTERRAVGFLFDASRRTEVDRFTIDATGDYSDDKDLNAGSPTFGERRLTQRRVGGGLKYDYFLSKRWYLLATARALGDTLADLQLRFTTGAGLGYTVIDDGTTLFLVEAGLAYLSENYRSAAPSVDYVSARIAYRLEHQFNPDTRMVHRLEAFPSVSDSDEYYLQAVTEVSTSLTESMVASVSWVLDYDNTPAPGREKADNRFLLAIGWSF